MEILLNAGASPDILDSAGWTPQEHAVFRGYLNIAKMLKDRMKLSVDRSPALISPIQTSLEEQDSAEAADRSYGHQYLSDQCMIMVTLGVNDIRQKTASIELAEGAFPSHPSLSLLVSAHNANGMIFDYFF